MNKRIMWRLLIFVAVAIAMTGCGFQTTQTALRDAGFEKKPADTPAKLEHLKTLNQQKLIRHERNGMVYYVYADAADCECMYIGDEEAYRQYRRIMERIRDMEQPVPGPEGLDLEMNREMQDTENP